MTKGEETKEKIIRQAAGLFWAKGYTATGVQDVLTAAGAKKTSALPRPTFMKHRSWA